MRVYPDNHDIKRCSATKFLNDELLEDEVQMRRVALNNNRNDPSSNNAADMASISVKKFSINCPSIAKMIERRIDTSPSFGSGINQIRDRSRSKY